MVPLLRLSQSDFSPTVNQKEGDMICAMADNDPTQKDNGELMFVVTSKEKENWELLPKLQKT